MNIKPAAIAGVVVFSMLVAPLPSRAEEQGTVDWIKGFVVATGQGTASAKEPKIQARLKAIRAAEIAAQRALLEVVKGVRIDSQTVVRNMLLEEDVIKTRVEGFLKGAIVTKREVEYVDEAPLATVEMKVCMTGSAEECNGKLNLVTVLEVDRRKEPPFVPADRLVTAGSVADGTQNPVGESASQPAPPAATAPPAPPASAPAYDPARPVTGLIINLEGRYFERELLPVVITVGSDSKPKTVYSVKSVAPIVVRTYGAVRYADSIDNARQNPAAGGNPLVVSVEAVTKENMLMLRPSDAKLVLETVSHGNNYLGDAKVIIAVR